ncbi:MAG: hypothetical protein PWQ79_700 [Thermococcaceae archaeon]|nr:hypothetical protein [Thermococcaceae archaeon]
MKRRNLPVSALFISIMLLSTTAPLIHSQEVQSLTLTVYEDGYVLVNETITTVNYTVVLEVPLLGEHVEGILAVDERGEVLPVEIEGGNATVYFEDSQLITLSYYTPDLTSKEGPVWTLSLESPVPVRILLPADAVIVDLSSIPLEIKGTTVLMPAGNVTVSYVLEGAGATYTTGSGGDSYTTSGANAGISQSSAPQKGGSSSVLKFAGVLVLLGLLALGAYFYFQRNRTQIPPQDFPRSEEALERIRERIESIDDLNDDERGALIFLLENGGKAPQAKIRKALGIPKSTAWRMFRRLEERGLVRVYRLGRENWVELRVD